MNKIIELFSALLTPTLAVVAVYIAYHQFKINRYKARVDLYEKRFHMYQKALDLIQRMSNGNESPDEIVLEFKKSTAGAYFLFGEEVGKYFNTLCEKAIEYQLIEEQLRKLPYSEEEQLSKRDDKLKIKKWFFSQFEESRSYFIKYLKFDEI